MKSKITLLWHRLIYWFIQVLTRLRLYLTRIYPLEPSEEFPCQRQMESKILEFSEREQQRMGRFLHDNIGQMLSGLRLISLNLSRKFEANGISGAKEVKEISDLIQKVDQQVRTFSHGMATSGIEEDTVQESLRQLAIKANEFYGIQCTFETDLTITLEAENTIRNMYRIAQEAIRNAVVHGEADKVDIRLEDHDTGLLFTIVDNGTGFSQSLEEAKAGGIGIATMRYRSDMLGGKLSFDENENGQTRVSCFIAKSGYPSVTQMTSFLVISGYISLFL